MSVAVARSWENETRPNGAVNTIRPLTHSSGTSREGLAMKATRVCSVDDCDRTQHARELCSTHYHRLLRGHSDPLGPVMFTPGRPIGERLLAQREVTAEGCWRWTGSHNPKGYGQMRVGKRKVDTHRLAYEAWIGPIPDGLEVDHVANRGCAHRDCFNPAHLEAVTHAENLRRAREAGRAS